MQDVLKTALVDSIELRSAMLQDTFGLATLARVAEEIATRLSQGRRLFIAGNGGSAADAQHFAAELTGRFLKERRALPALALSTDTSFLTAWSNDYSYDTVFSRQLEAHASKGDVFVSLSTSGSSKNLIEALKRAHTLGVYTVSLLGRDGGAMRSMSDVAYIVPAEETARIQEVHITLIHTICQYVDEQVTHERSSARDE